MLLTFVTIFATTFAITFATTFAITFATTFATTFALTFDTTVATTCEFCHNSNLQLYQFYNFVNDLVETCHHYLTLPLGMLNFAEEKIMCLLHAVHQPNYQYSNTNKYIVPAIRLYLLLVYVVYIQSTVYPRNHLRPLRPLRHHVSRDMTGAQLSWYSSASFSGFVMQTTAPLFKST